MPQHAAPSPQSDPDRLEVATGQAIAACGGNPREPVKGLIGQMSFLSRNLRFDASSISRLRAWKIQNLYRLNAMAEDVLRGIALHRH